MVDGPVCVQRVPRNRNLFLYPANDRVEDGGRARFLVAAAG